MNRGAVLRFFCSDEFFEPHDRPGNSLDRIHEDRGVKQAHAPRDAADEMREQHADEGKGDAHT